jgi:hypothetical protein
MSRPIHLASTFHDMARPFLSGLGLELESDPNEIRNPYQATGATYKSRNGFFLAVGFNPLDGCSARMMCGRRWNYTSDIPGLEQFERWSNDYFVLARRFGFDLPNGYQLDVDDVANTDLRKILDDLEQTLPTILERVTVDDLIAIEREKFGCEWREERDSYQSASVRFEDITPFEARPSSD